MNAALRNDNATGQGREVGKTQSTKPAFSFPSAQSVKGRVLGSLLRGERLTHLDCWRRFGSARLSHHIYVLRGIGWDVQIIEQTVTTSDAGRPATIGIYFLTSDVICEAGALGQAYAEIAARVEAERQAA